MTVTRDDVARRAGVSVATVSYVLNDGPKPVSDEKRRRVLAAVADLGYRPNAIARSLRARRTRILGLVLPDSANPYFAALSRAIEEAASQRGYQVVIANSADDPQREAAQIEAIFSLRVDGLLWIPADIRSGRRVPHPGVPTVQVDRPLPIEGDGVDVIASDNEQGGHLGCRHLLDLGHTRIACLAGPSDHLHAQDRLRGVRAALREAGLTLPPARLAYGTFDYASGARLAARWAALPAAERPTGIVCGNDAMALGALCALSDAGLPVPEAVSVIGYDDIPQAAYAVPPLTTVAQPLAAMGAAAVERLLTRVGAPAEEAPRAAERLPVQLTIRRSTAPPPA